MKWYYRFSPLPPETSAIPLVLCYALFFLLLKRSATLALLAPVVFGALLLICVVGDACRLGVGRSYLWSRLAALCLVALPIIAILYLR
jgi:hypothetical protein